MPKPPSEPTRPYTIRPATAGDAEGLAACLERAYAAYRTQFEDLPDVAGGIDRDIAENRVWVADSNGEIVAGVVVAEGTDHAVLANIGVDPVMRGQGVARSLIDFVEEDCIARGIRSIRLSTHAGMPENVRLYEYLGWRVTGRDARKVSMEKEL